MWIRLMFWTNALAIGLSASDRIDLAAFAALSTSTLTPMSSDSTSGMGRDLPSRKRVTPIMIDTDGPRKVPLLIRILPTISLFGDANIAF
jgi:hypothetical protein